MIGITPEPTAFVIEILPLARTSKYTPERVETVLAGVRAGLTYRLAAASAGISDDTLTRWKASHADFAERLLVVEAEAAQEALKQIGNASRDDWRAAAWILEHRHPHDYGKSVQEQHHSGSVDVKVEFAYNEVPSNPKPEAS